MAIGHDRMRSVFMWSPKLEPGASSVGTAKRGCTIAPGARHHGTAARKLNIWTTANPNAIAAEAQ